MEDRRPDSRPAHKVRINRRLVLRYNVIDRVIKQGDQPRDANNSQRLRGKHTKDHRGQRGREQSLVDAVEVARPAVHVECVCYCREDAALC